MKNFQRALFLLVAVLAHEAQAILGTAFQAQLGNPSSASANASNRTNYLLARPQYVLSYNDATHEANWVSWDYTPADRGTADRSDAFAADPLLPAGYTVIDQNSYRNSGFDRGHMCPSADRTLTLADNQATFYMTNMVPQTPDNNQGPWARFEDECRRLADLGNEMLIISGPGGFDGSTIASGVAIPGFTWKIAVVVPNGPQPATARITAATRVIAIKMPNIAGIRSTPWQNFITSAAEIEQDTGYAFFSDVPPEIAAALRARVDGQPDAARLANLATRTTAGIGDQVAIAGFVIGGTQPKTVLVRAIGPALRDFGVTTAVGAPRLEVTRVGTTAPLATNLGWSTSANPIELATAATLAGAFPLAPGGADSAVLMTLAPGNYTAVVSPADARPGITLAEVYDVAPAANTTGLINLSTRAFVGTAENVLIAGIVVSGTAPKRVLIRAAGPALAQFNVSGVLARPQLTVFSSANILAQNAGWSTAADASAIVDATTATGAFAFPAGSADAALLLLLGPGAYTAHVTGVAGSTGIALVEVYEVP
jgi:DNA/RNA endonuclease G (NUC1)